MSEWWVKSEPSAGVKVSTITAITIREVRADETADDLACENTASQIPCRGIQRSLGLYSFKGFRIHVYPGNYSVSAAPITFGGPDMGLYGAYTNDTDIQAEPTGKNDSACSKLMLMAVRNRDGKSAAGATILGEGMRACFSAEGFNMNTGEWTSQSVNNMSFVGVTGPAAGGGITLETDSVGENGVVANDLLYIAGGKNDHLSLGKVRGRGTFCSMTRYTGKNASTMGRIVNAGNGSWVHGHWMRRAGVAYYGTWITSKENQVEA